MRGAGARRFRAHWRDLLSRTCSAKLVAQPPRRLGRLLIILVDVLPRLLLLACGRLAREAAPRPIEVLQRHAAHGQGQRRGWAGCGEAEGRRRGVWGVPNGLVRRFYKSRGKCRKCENVRLCGCAVRRGVSH